MLASATGEDCNGHDAIVSLLLQAGADPIMTYPGSDVTALVQAASNGHTAAVRRLLAHGAVDRQNPGLALQAATQEGHPARARGGPSRAAHNSHLQSELARAACQGACRPHSPELWATPSYSSFRQLSKPARVRRHTLSRAGCGVVALPVLGILTNETLDILHLL